MQVTLLHIPEKSKLIQVLLDARAERTIQYTFLYEVCTGGVRVHVVPAARGRLSLSATCGSRTCFPNF